MKIAFITGINGQDGSYLAEYLLELNYKVIGLVRRKSIINYDNISHLQNNKNLILEDGDITDISSLIRIINKWNPNEVYNLAAQSFVGVSFKEPIHTSEVDGIGVLNILEVLRIYSPNTRFYQASTSEMFGKVNQIPQNENTPFNPRSPYGCAKVFAHFCVKNYREAYNLYAVSGILFNHESPRRGTEFVTQKIVKGIKDILDKKITKIELGNIDSKRDWGYAGDYVKAMHLMLQQKYPKDYVIATGETHSVREFLNEAFSYVGLNYQDYIVINKDYYRPSEVDLLVGDSTLAKNELGWEPKIKFNELIKLMIDYVINK